MDRKDKKKIFSILFFVLIGVMLVVNFFVFKEMGDSNKKTEEVMGLQTQVNEKNEEENTQEKEQKEKEVDELRETKDETKFLYRAKIAAVGSGKEYPQGKSGLLKQELLKLAEVGDYASILDKGNNYTAEYSFSEGENLDIAGILYDANTMLGVAKEKNRYVFGENVKNSKTPEMLVASTLWSDNFSRRPVIEDKQSIGPVGYDRFSFLGKRVLRDKEEVAKEPTFQNRNIAQDIFNGHPDVNAIYVYEMSLINEESLPLTVYVWEDLFGDLHFYGMYIPDNIKHYAQTLAWWIEHDYLYEAAEKQQEEFYQEDKSGKITKEDIDKLFESGW